MQTQRVRLWPPRPRRAPPCTWPLASGTATVTLASVLPGAALLPVLFPRPTATPSVPAWVPAPLEPHLLFLPDAEQALDAALTASVCSKNRTGSPDLLTRGGGPSSIKPLVSTSCMPGTERGTQCGKQQAHGHPGWSGLRHQRVSCRGIHTV